MLKRSVSKRGVHKRISMHERICEKSREQEGRRCYHRANERQNGKKREREQSKSSGYIVVMQRQRETERTDMPKSGRA